ncbi:MAG: hypothetical protein QGG40_20835, partial [Myxococcota bacterium]|nr:hypothetical protein [Myxococcota bacterium]
HTLYTREGPEIVGGIDARAHLVVLLPGLLGALGFWAMTLGPTRRAAFRTGTVIVALTGVLAGATGLLLWSFVLFSGHPDLSANDNIYALWPTDLVLLGVGAASLFRGHWKSGPWLRRYAQLHVLVAVGATLANLVGLLPQDNLAVYGQSAALWGGVLACWNRTRGATQG